MDSIFEQMANISKAHGYDILTGQVRELKQVIKCLISAGELDNLEFPDKDHTDKFKNILKTAKILSL